MASFNRVILMGNLTRDVEIKYLQSGMAVADVGAGTGLGLSITYGILKDHHGSISVQSPNGQGARFVVELPLAGEGHHPQGGKPS